MNLDIVAFTKAIPTLNNRNEATGDTCNIFTSPSEECNNCVFYHKTTNKSTCSLHLSNPEYITFLQTYFPELLI